MWRNGGPGTTDNGQRTTDYQGNRMRSRERMAFALEGQPESSPVASALGPRRREVPPSPERTAEAGNQSSSQDFGRPARSRTQG